jgi:anaphase-promoting complex subunit 2
MAPDSSICVGRSHIFSSVFAPCSLGDPIPTRPSPKIAADNSTIRQETQLPDKPTWDRAWRLAVSFLTMPDAEFEPLLRITEMGETEFLRLWNRYKKPSKETRDAFNFLAKGSLEAAGSVYGSIFSWYESEIRRHFMQNFKGDLFMVRDHFYLWPIFFGRLILTFS